MPRKPSNRRQFLSGQAAADSLATARDNLVQGGESAYPKEPILEVSRRAMACEFAVIQRANQQGPEAEWAMEALDLVEEIEDQLTVYRETSEVSQLNRRASSQPVLVSRDLLQLIQLSLQISAETDGAFDITAGPLSKLWGFHHRNGQLPAADAIAPVLDRVGRQWLDVNDLDETIAFAKPGMEINFGAIGKGYALDQAGDVLLEHGVENFILHGGMSSMLARGTRADLPDIDDTTDQPSPPKDTLPGPGWRIAIRNPVVTQQRLIEVTLHNQALATSGSANQFFYFQGKRFSHVIDPRIGWPVEGTWSTTVVAANAALADALATALFVMGKDAALELCRKRGDIAAWIVTPGAKSGALDLHVVGVDEIDWQLLSEDVTVRT